MKKIYLVSLLGAASSAEALSQKCIDAMTGAAYYFQEINLQGDSR